MALNMGRSGGELNIEPTKKAELKNPAWEGNMEKIRPKYPIPHEQNPTIFPKKK